MSKLFSFLTLAILSKVLASCGNIKDTNYEEQTEVLSKYEPTQDNNGYEQAEYTQEQLIERRENLNDFFRNSLY
ncbi:MAG: hypothetical protein FWF50_00070 [Defluviitaleaceae bacterium]|nr:hypothetical protein [Defluviitaleaceae bacterium]